MRIIDPVRVAGWFRPPAQWTLEKLAGKPNGTYTTVLPTKQRLDTNKPPDLELYNIRTDAWGLWALAMLLLAMADAVPLPKSLVGSSLADPAPSQYKKPYARAAIVITIFHHITTGIGAWTHWRLQSHHTVAMDIGVYGNIALTALGVAALVYGFGEKGGVKKRA